VAPVQAVVFDFHETLISADAWMAFETGGLAAAIPRSLGMVPDPVPADAAERIKRAYAQVRAVSAGAGIEYSASQVGRAILRALGRDAEVSDAALGEVIDRLYRGYLSDVTFKPGAAGMLEGLERLGCRLAIVSNAAHAAFLGWALDAGGVRGRFQSVTVSADVGIRKPRPEIFEAALRALGVRAAESVYVGNDYIKDVIGAKLAGMAAVWMPDAGAGDPRAYTTVQPDAVIGDLSALPSLVRGWMRRLG
jgi:putative hydrolase of the HAD superfamily